VQEFEVTSKSMEFDSTGVVQPEAAELPLFWSVKVLGLDEAPTTMLPKSWPRGAQASEGAAAIAS
jgi:hypothetical protein